MENRTEADEIVTRMAGHVDVAAMLACDAYAQAYPERGEAVRAAVDTGTARWPSAPARWPAMSSRTTTSSATVLSRWWCSLPASGGAAWDCDLDEGDPELVYVKWCR